MKNLNIIITILCFLTVFWFGQGINNVVYAASGTLSCSNITTSSIDLDYSYVDGENVHLLKDNEFVTKVFKDIDSIKIIGLSSNQEYVFRLVNNGEDGELLAKTTCSTKKEEGVITPDPAPDPAPAPAPSSGSRSSGISFTQLETEIQINSWVRSINRNTDWQKEITVAPGEKISIALRVSVSSKEAENVFVRNISPDNLINLNNIIFNGESFSGNIEEGINFGTIKVGESKTVIFDAEINSSENFETGSTNLINSIFVSSGDEILNDTVEINVVKGIVAGAATSIVTGITNNKFIDFILLPLFFTFLIFFLFRKYFIVATDQFDRMK